MSNNFGFPPDRPPGLPIGLLMPRRLLYDHGITTHEGLRADLRDRVLTWWAPRLMTLPNLSLPPNVITIKRVCRRGEQGRTAP